MKELVKKITKNKDKTDAIQSGTIISLVAQSSTTDYYDIKINGTYYSNVPCPLPSYLQKQLQLVNSVTLLVTQNRTLRVERTPLFSPDETVQVIFEGGNKSAMKINLEKSVIKYKDTEIIYI